VPTVFLSELENANLANVSTLERFLWRNTIVPELRLIEDFLNRSLLPRPPTERNPFLGLGQFESRYY
jgi:hypothetical protein